VDRPNPNMYPGTVPTQPQDGADPPGGYAGMPAAAPDPAAGDNAPMRGDVPPMRTPAASARFDPWNYREEAELGDGADVIGFRVEAADGHIGKIDAASTLVGDSYLVVDTGPWIFGKKVLLPAGTVSNVDSLESKIYVDRTKDQIKESPEFDPDTYNTPEYRDKLGGYYGDTYGAVPGAAGYAGAMVPPLSADTAGSEPPSQVDVNP
jgi:PRC-barrel domain